MRAQNEQTEKDGGRELASHQANHKKKRECARKEHPRRPADNGRKVMGEEEERKVSEG